MLMSSVLMKFGEILKKKFVLAWILILDRVISVQHLLSGVLSFISMYIVCDF